VNGTEGSKNLLVGVQQEPPEGAVSRDGWLLHFVQNTDYTSFFRSEN